MSLLVVSSERFAHHVTPPGHPERVERARVLEGAAIGWRARSGAVVAPRPATEDELAAAHHRDYVRAIAATSGRAVKLDPDTFTSVESYDVAVLAAGASLVALDHALSGNGPALALVRPPGHHAEADRAMGFCLFNNVAVAAASARARGVDRVAIVDFDVHHGNGTQAIFYDDPNVLYVSIHQFPFYPGTGAASEVGAGGGRGATVNVPLELGATDADYDLVVASIVEPVLAEFAPDLILVSAGFDLHARDPLAQMRVTTDGCARLMASLWHAASTVCEGRLVAVTEGGYDLQALGDCLDETIAVLASPPPVRVRADLRPDESACRGAAAIAAVRRAQTGLWRQL